MDRNKFVELLADSLSVYDVTLYSYILMNNHFHLLIQTAKANLSEFMRRFNICYTGWFNYRHKFCGHLYQGRYKAFLIDADSYLLEVSRYVHLNIIRSCKIETSFNEKWNTLHQYRWSSLHGYLKKSKREPFINYDFILSIVGNHRHYRQFISDGLKRGVGNPFEKVKYDTILGPKDFVTEVKAHCADEGSIREQPSFRNLTIAKVDYKSIIDCVADTLGVTQQQIITKLGHDVARGITAELLYRYSGIKQNRIGEILGNIDYSAVSHMRRRLKSRIEKNKNIERLYKKVEMRLKNFIQNSRFDPNSLEAF